MNRNTGLGISDTEHISQSMRDILLTPVGSRVMRREYGSLLSALIDMPQNPALRLQIMVACYSAIQKWEPRIRGLPASALRPVTLAKCMSILPGCVPIPVRQFQPLFH
jgi:phage baseplate assembly protein W